MKKQLGLFAASLAAFTALAGFGVAPSVSALADTCTWTGTTNSNFNDAGNWTGCDNGTLPEAGDTLKFPSTSTGSWTLNNDLGLSFAGVIVEVSTSQPTTYVVNNLLLANGAVIDSSTSGAFQASLFEAGSTTTQGTLTIKGGYFQSTTWTLGGALTLAEDASFDGANVHASGVTIQKGGSLFFASSTPGSTPSFPITLGGGSASKNPVIYFSGTGTWTFANPLTLLSNAQILLSDAGTVVEQTGSISGAGFSLTLDPASAAGSRLTFNPSTNDSDTVAGTVVAGTNGSAAGNAAVNDVKAPDTGFALVAANPVQSLAILSLAGAAMFFMSRRVLAKSAVRR